MSAGQQTTLGSNLCSNVVRWEWQSIWPTGAADVTTAQRDLTIYCPYAGYYPQAPNYPGYGSFVEQLTVWDAHGRSQTYRLDFTCTG
jgi:hypothetical protein